MCLCKDMCVHVCLCGDMCVGVQMPQRPELSDPSGADDTGGCEAPNLSPENWDPLQEQ